MSIYRERLRKVRQEMEERGIELLVLPPSPSMFYVTGIRGQPHFEFLKGPGDWLNGVFIGVEQGPVFVVNWEVHRILLRSSGIPTNVIAETRVLEHGADPMVLLGSLLDEFGLIQKRIALTDRTWTRFAEAIRTLLPNAEIVMASEFMDGLLAIKDEAALRLMRRVAEITDKAYAETLKSLRFGVTEEDVALEVDYQIRKFGAEGNSFKTSVVFTRPGDTSPSPGQRLRPGDSVIFDLGAVFEGYCSDFGRSAFAGDPPREYLDVHELVLQAQAEAMSAMKPGEITCEEVVAVVHQPLADGGFGAYLIPAAGHGIGMTVHELPLLFGGDRTVIQKGMTFTVEPTLRVPGRFSNRVEDVVLVGEEGAMYLTNHPRDLHIVTE